MLELFEKVVLTTIGVASITQKKTEELVTEMKEKLKLSDEEGKSLIDRVKTFANESREKIRETADEEVKKAVDRLGLVSREEFDLLKKRVQELEERTN